MVIYSFLTHPFILVFWNRFAWKFFIPDFDFFGKSYSLFAWKFTVFDIKKLGKSKSVCLKISECPVSFLWKVRYQLSWKLVVAENRIVWKFSIFEIQFLWKFSRYEIQFPWKLGIPKNEKFGKKREEVDDTSYNNSPSLITP